MSERRVMDKVWLRRFTFRGFLLVSLLALPCLTMAEFKKGPYLVYKNNQTQMTIMWEQAASGAGVVSWGSSTAYGSSGTGTVVSANLYRYNITGLTPGQKVFYKVVANGKTAQNFFYAVPNHTNAVTLYAGGDSRDGTVNKGHSLTEQVFSRMLTDIDQNQAARNTLMLFSGDMVNVGNSDTDWQKWFKPEYSGYSSTPSMTAFFQRIPIMNTIGNHETYANDSSNLDLTAAKTRKFYPYSYVNISNGLYYTFTYGPVRILVIDNERSISAGSAQYQWIENTLVP
ncbi:MAG: hypothetical protein FJ220_07350, partial [Kiritimatiellaceae bacterium]|nr:hypothetical protein [Kiritimatiellaceae bacterium]